MTIAELTPGLTRFWAAFLIPLFWGQSPVVCQFRLPAQVWLYSAVLAPGDHGVISFLGQQLVTLRVDRWVWFFPGCAYLLSAALISSIYSLHAWLTPLQATAGCIRRRAIGAVFAGDLMTLFLFWN